MTLDTLRCGEFRDALVGDPLTDKNTTTKRGLSVLDRGDRSPMDGLDTGLRQSSNRFCFAEPARMAEHKATDGREKHRVRLNQRASYTTL